VVDGSVVVVVGAVVVVVGAVVVVVVDVDVEVEVVLVEVDPCVVVVGGRVVVVVGLVVVGDPVVVVVVACVVVVVVRPGMVTPGKVGVVGPAGFDPTVVLTKLNRVVVVLCFLGPFVEGGAARTPSDVEVTASISSSASQEAPPTVSSSTFMAEASTYMRGPSPRSLTTIQAPSSVTPMTSTESPGATALAWIPVSHE
jgi:hypothetical protein